MRQPKKWQITRLFFIGLAFLLLTYVTAFAALPDPNSNEPCDGLVARAIKASRQQGQRLPAYSVVRRYTITNKHLAGPAYLEVRWKYQPGAGKQYEILPGGSASGVARDALVKILHEEAASSRLDEDPAAVTPDHYSFEASGEDTSSYKLHVTPKQKTKYLLDGFAYLTRDGAVLVRLQGTTANRISFWVGEAEISQEFANYNGYWLPSRTRSKADVRIIGSTELTVEAIDYSFEPEK